MPFVLVGRNRRGLVWGVLGWLVGSLALPMLARAICCDQPSAQMNANLVCNKNATACLIGAQTIDGPGTCAKLGCELDFGARPVTFDGTFTLGSGTLTVRALTLTINKAINANGALAVDLATTGTTCANGVGDLVVRQVIDVSSANAGTIRLAAGCRVSLEGNAQLVANASNFGTEGTIDVRAGTSIVQAGTIRAIGTGNNGGSVSLRAGDDVQVQKTIDVHSNGDGEGGQINLTAGDASIGGAAPGGALTVDADLIADGSTDTGGEDGEDGGGITLQASGPVLVTSTAMIRANGGQPNGSGGTFSFFTQEFPAGVLTALDGDVVLQGPIILHAASDGYGGDIDGTSGRGLQITGSIDLSGGGDDSNAGNMIATAGGDIRVEGLLSVNGRVADSTGGYVDLRAGFATSTATLTVAKPIDVSAGPGSDAGEIRLASCNLTVQPNVLLDARSSLLSLKPAITLAANTALTVGTGSRFLAPPSSSTLIAQTSTTNVSIASGTTFNPPAVTTIVTPKRSPLPPCPVCGDGIRAQGEPCDPGAGADGACCSSDCLVRLCPTPTRSPTPTQQATGPTPTATPTSTPTATVTPSPTATVTPGLPPIAPRAVLSCERALAKGTSRLVTTELAFLENCSLDALGCIAVGVADPTACLARVSRRCQSRFTKLVRARQKFDAAFTKSCAGDPPALAFPLLRSPDVLAFADLDDVCAADVGLALTSPSAVRACVARAACAGEHALGIAVPHLGSLLSRVFDASSAELCFEPGAQVSTPSEVQPSRPAVRCQRAIVTAGRKLLVKQMAVAARCVDSLFGCRLAGGTPSSCASLAESCNRKLAAFQDTSDGTRARLTATIVHACSAVPADQIALPSGLGFANVGAACLGVGEPAPVDPQTIAPCLATVYGCASGAIVRRALPLVDSELARVGLALPDDFACPSVAPTATPTVTPTSAIPTRTPTVTPTPTVVPTTAPVTVLIPGGGTGTSDCVAEWTVVGVPVEPPPVTTFTCTDGDPACDLDGTVNDLCHFAVGVCFANTDTALPECSGVGGLTAYTLQSPQPSAANPVDASNAAALIAILTDRFGVAPGGLGQNRYTFGPPLALTAPDNCTAPTSLAVERRGLVVRTERFRGRAIANAAGGVLDDSDNLLLTCVAPGS